MYDENMNGENRNDENSVNSSPENQERVENMQTEQENHEYRYGRSYYQRQQDSVYHTNENTQANHTNTYQNDVYENGNSYSQNTTYQNQESDYQNNWNTQQGQNTWTGNGTENAWNNQTNYQTTEDAALKSKKKEKKKDSGIGFWKVVVAIIAVVVVASGSAFGTMVFTKGLWNAKTASNKRVATVESTSDNSDDVVEASSTVNSAIVTDVSKVVSNVMPSVVAITNVGTQTISGFWGQSGTYEYESSGSGIIIGQTDSELLIVTNQHVVAGADKLKIVFIDEESCEANVKGTDAEKDLAVIAVQLDNVKDSTLGKIKVATLGDSNAVNVGEPAIAIGNALGYGQSVTLGVISAKNREVTTETATNKLIQTDAAINPGNSGGALLNIEGEVIGINSVKYSSTEVEGMGYAIPISEATPIINELMNKETKIKVDDKQKSYLGITGVDITTDEAQYYNMPKGVYVAQVVEDSPADKAGIKKGDIITKLADVSVTSFEELRAELEYHAAGDTIPVEFLSQVENSYGYETKTVDVTLAKKEDR